MKSLSFLLLFLFACAPMTTTSPQMPSTSSPIVFAASAVSPGTIRLSLDNGSSQPIGYNLCTSELQRHSGSTWTRVATDEVCTMELRTLQPGADATFDKHLPAALAAGEYRYVTNIENPVGGQRMTLATDPFTVS